MIGPLTTSGQVVPLKVTIDSSPGLTDWISVALTAALVLTAIWALVYSRKTVKEMATQREADMAARRRERSERAAESCLDAVRSVTDEMLQRGASAVGPDILRSTRASLAGHGPLIDDERIRDHVAAAAEVVIVGAFATDQMQTENLSGGLVALGVQEILRALRTVLECYLAERNPAVDPWSGGGDPDGRERLPDRTGAAAWIRRYGHSTLK